MAEPNANYLDTFLKVWAVLGPLIAAAASAMWSRHIQNSDRQFERLREKERGAQERERRHEEQEREKQMKKYSEVKAGIADFMASSHEYVRKQSDYLTNPISGRYEAATTANDKFVYSCQLATLLGNIDLANKATALWNATLPIPKSYNTPINSEYADKLSAYRASRAEFNDAARAYLAELETITPNTTLNRGE